MNTERAAHTVAAIVTTDKNRIPIGVVNKLCCLVNTRWVCASCKAKICRTCAKPYRWGYVRYCSCGGAWYWVGGLLDV